MQDFDLIHTKGGKAKIRLPIVFELELEIEEWIRFSNRCEETRDFGEPIDWSKKLPSADDVLEWHLMEADCHFREFAWNAGEFLMGKLVDARDYLEKDVCIFDDCREKLERLFVEGE